MAGRSAADRPAVICATAMTGGGWRWFEDDTADRVRWEFFDSTPRGLLERRIRRPSLARTSCAWRAASAARSLGAALLVSHDPNLTARLAEFSRLQGIRAPHIAWSFNFSRLPRDPARRLMARAFRRVDRFIVYSTMERSLYANYFAIPEEKIQVALWAVGDPLVTDAEAPLESGDYACAIGGNARDYPTLLSAMRRVPEVRMVLVIRPESLQGLEVPPNVKVHVNLPLGRTNNVLRHSRFMVLPLAGSEVPCGHVTLVSAMKLGRASIVTDSSGLADYFAEGVNALSYPAGDAEALADRIRQLWGDPAQAERLGEESRRFAMAHLGESQIRDRLRHVLHEFGVLPA